MESPVESAPLVYGRARGSANLAGLGGFLSGAAVAGEFQFPEEGVEPGTDDEERADEAPEVGDIAPDQEAQQDAPDRARVAERRHDRDSAGPECADVEEVCERHEA